MAPPPDAALCSVGLGDLLHADQGRRRGEPKRSEHALVTDTGLAGRGRQRALGSRAAGGEVSPGEPVDQQLRQHPAAFTEKSVQVATVLAAHLAALFAIAASTPASARHPGRAVQARDVIGQAKAC